MDLLAEPCVTWSSTLQLVLKTLTESQQKILWPVFEAVSSRNYKIKMCALQRDVSFQDSGNLPLSLSQFNAAIYRILNTLLFLNTGDRLFL